MSLNEKSVQGSTEPLVLRPPVGSEVYNSPGVRFRALFNSPVDSHRRRRLLCHCLVSLLLALIAIAVLLFIMFVVGFGPTFPGAHRSSMTAAYRSQQPYSMCRVLIPVLRVHMTELISPMDNMFNVTLMDDDSTSGMHTVRILHLCKEGLTVIRDDNRCYIRPMRQGWRRLCSESYMERMRTAAAVRPAIAARLNDERWFIDDSSTFPNVINNSYIMAWCEGVPAFRLVSNPPSDGYSVSADETRPIFDMPPPPPPPQEDLDRAEVFDAFLHPDPPLSQQHGDVLINAMDSPLVRRARQLDLSEAMGVEPDQLPVARQTNRVTDKKTTRRRITRRSAVPAPKKCKEVTTLLEDATLQLPGDPEVSSVSRDQIILCDS